MVSNVAHADEQVISGVLDSGIVVNADYSFATNKYPAVLLLHGFLQTRQFSTVVSMKGALADSGYTTLAPTFSLGISNRRRSLPCSAIHTHTMEEDVAEIDFWVKWLLSKGHEKVVIVGHSFGSLQGLAYINKYSNHVVKSLVAVSLVDVENEVGKAGIKKQIESANRTLATDAGLLGKYHVSFCKEYVAPPAAVLSYAKWSRFKIISALKNLTDVKVIMGSADDRMNADWAERLEKNGVEITLIEGANHFFDGLDEFDLNENVISAVTAVSMSHQ